MTPPLMMVPPVSAIDVDEPETGTTAEALATLERIATRDAPADLLGWIDSFALAIAAGVRVGERGLLGASPANGNDVASTQLARTRDSEVMDADEVAGFLGVVRKTVYDYAGRGDLPCRRLGKRLLFSRQALIVWLSGCKVVSRVNGA